MHRTPDDKQVPRTGRGRESQVQPLKGATRDDLLHRDGRAVARHEERAVALIHHQIPGLAAIIRPANVLRVQVVVCRRVAAGAARVVAHPDLDRIPARLRRLERLRRGDDGARCRDVFDKRGRFPGSRIGNLNALAVIDVRAEEVALAAFQVHLAPVDPLAAVLRPVDLVVPDRGAALLRRRPRSAADIGGQHAQLTAVDAIAVLVVEPVRPRRELGIALAPVRVRPREERLVQPGLAEPFRHHGRLHAQDVALDGLTEIVADDEADEIRSPGLEPREAKLRAPRLVDRLDLLRPVKRRGVEAILKGQRRGCRTFTQPLHVGHEVGRGVGDGRGPKRRKAKRRVGHKALRLVIRKKAPVDHRVVFGLHPVGRGRAAHQAALVERALNERLRAI